MLYACSTEVTQDQQRQMLEQAIVFSLSPLLKIQEAKRYNNCAGLNIRGAERTAI